MNLHDGATLYDILDLSSNASPQEVREAYVRTKSTFHRDNLALYSLITPEEREEALKKIEEAYLTLSNPEKRREYDQNHGLLNVSPKVVSIDRVPPMENIPDGEALLVPPKTDFPSDPLPRPSENNSQPLFSAKPLPHPPAAPSLAFKGADKNASYLPKIDSMLVHAIDIETEWQGAFLRKVREAYKISLEEMAGTTKITKNYISAIEDENYSRLPAAAYIRGFVAQIAKALKLPHEKVASAYLSRYHRSQTE